MLRVVGTAGRHRAVRGVVGAAKVAGAAGSGLTRTVDAVAVAGVVTVTPRVAALSHALSEVDQEEVVGTATGGTTSRLTRPRTCRICMRWS